MNNIERISYFDQMRGVAILAMVIGHVFLFAFGIHNCPLAGSLNIFAMPVFFYVSGFFSFKELNSFNQLFSRINRRLLRILPPWIVASVAYSLYNKCGVIHCLTDFYWFFYVLTLCVLIFIILDFLILRYTKLLYPVVTLFILCVLGTLAYMYGDSSSIPLNQLARYSCYFAVGWLCRKYNKLHECLLNSQLLYAVSIIFYLYACFNFQTINIVERMVASMAAIIVIQSFFAKRAVTGASRLLKVLSLLGQSTIAIYILNNYFIPDLTTLNIPFENISQSYIVELIISLCVSIPVIGLCVVIKLIMQNNKYLKYLVS